MGHHATLKFQSTLMALRILWQKYVFIVVLFPSLAAELRGQLIIPVAHYHSSGISLKALAGLHRHLHMGLTYSHVVQGMQSNVPFSGTLQLDIWNVDKEPERVIYAKYDIISIIELFKVYNYYLHQ